MPAQGKVSAYGSVKGTGDVECEQEGLVFSTPFGRAHAGSCLLFLMARVSFSLSHFYFQGLFSSSHFGDVLNTDET